MKYFLGKRIETRKGDQQMIHLKSDSYSPRRWQ